MQWQKSVQEIILSHPIEVHFAGFVSDTFKLSRQGWGLAVEQQVDMYRVGYHARLALKHEGAGLYGVTHSIELPRQVMLSDMEFYKSYFRSVYFQVACMAPRIEARVMQMPHVGFSQFEPFDATPQREQVESIDKVRFFKTRNPDIKDIVVVPEMVPELMAMVLKAQEPMLDEVRKREKSRKNLERLREGYEVKPAHEVRAQIITLAG